MNNLLEVFQDQMTPDLVNYLSRTIGEQNSEKTETAASSLFGVLINAIQKNATSQQGGVDSLMGALNRDHDGSILDNAVDYLSGVRAPRNTNMLNSAGILGHLLGQNQNQVVDKVAQMVGMDKRDVGQLLLKMAPMIMGMVGKVQRQNNLNSSELINLLDNTTQEVRQRVPEVQQNFFEKLIDQDGDGSIYDDIADFGMKSLSNFFRK